MVFARGFSTCWSGSRPASEDVRAPAEKEERGAEKDQRSEPQGPREIPLDEDHQVSCVYYQSGYDSSVVRDEEIEMDSSGEEVPGDD